MPAYDFNLVPETELDAVNMMLLSIGLSPVNTLSVQGIKDVNISRLVLHNTLREVLSKGWDFNTDEDYPLSQDGNGKISIPASALSVDPMDQSQRFTQRRDPADSIMRLYNKETFSFVIGKTVKVEIVWMFPFADLPQSARSFISKRAGRIFQTDRKPSELLYRFTSEREMEAQVLFERDEGRSNDTNYFDYDTLSARVAVRHR